MPGLFGAPTAKAAAPASTRRGLFGRVRGAFDRMNEPDEYGMTLGDRLAYLGSQLQGFDDPRVGAAGREMYAQQRAMGAERTQAEQARLEQQGMNNTRQKQAIQLAGSIAPGDNAAMNAALLDPDAFLARYLENQAAANVSGGESRYNPMTGSAYTAPRLGVSDGQAFTQTPDAFSVTGETPQAGRIRAQTANAYDQMRSRAVQDDLTRARTENTYDQVRSRGVQDRIAQGEFDAEAQGRAQARRDIEGGLAQTLLQQRQYADSQIEDLQRIRDITQDGSGVGASSQLFGMVRGSQASDVRSLLDSVTGAVALERLENMRDMAAASGNRGSGLGQVTEREIAILRAARGALTQDMSPEQFNRSAARLFEQLQGVRAERERVIQRDFPEIYDRIYGGSAEGSGASTGGSDPGAPRPGDVIDGYEFLGGDPSDERSWRRR